MKQGRKPFRAEKELLREKHLLWKDWEVLESTPEKLLIRNKQHGNVKVVWK